MNFHINFRLTNKKRNLMKTSVRNKRFTIGMVLFVAIILILSVSSAFYLNKLSWKTNAILKENHYSVVYARDMSEALLDINQYITACFIANKKPDSLILNKEFLSYSKSYELEKNNLTEPGEDRLVSVIAKDYGEYHDSVLKVTLSPATGLNILNLQKKFDELYTQLMLLSHMNEKAIEDKTDDAKISARKATTQMTILGTICFLIAYGFSFVFSSYFNERFYRLYNGIKEIVKVNYRQKLYFDGNDEIFEISLIFNKMVDELNANKQKMSVILTDEIKKDVVSNDIIELKQALQEIKKMEEQTAALILRLEKK
jgi:NtrC-family two-component system sensor histidine kinase KinB